MIQLIENIVYIKYVHIYGASSKISLYIFYELARYTQYDIFVLTRGDSLKCIYIPNFYLPDEKWMRD